MTTPFRTLVEQARALDNVHQIELPVAEDKLNPVLSKDAVSLHYGTLYKNYVKKALAGDGAFQVAGAKLHTLFFEQFQVPQSPNNPTESAKDLIIKKFGSYQGLKDAVTQSALDIHGSGWVYLDTSGIIKTIENHKIVNDVALIIDMWEHSYIMDYGANKEKYLRDIWKIINWKIINIRLN